MVQEQSLMPSPEWTSWLTHKTALTEKLQHETGEARLKLIQQIKTNCNWWDRFFLGICEKNVIHRDVLMASQDQYCWFARSVIPLSTFDQNMVFFERLKTESLGQMVFNNPVVKRDCLSHYFIDKNSQEYHWMTPELRQNAPLLWVRYSRFLINENFPFYLVEILLPDLLRIAK
ncbi:4-hydroxybenzoate synthetase [Legionella birminghamensis]|uniref:4-hydroxybenzoate synthetase n=2 Tax=Legionella birminghamensis TaxID=28083 RepID=A0A378I8S9_9GAMM|nr:chorismate lyase [Legionella birminghamensis]KTC69287.1 4-hydroxybenzoate synthetase [Legionella birminghamensis]STX31549.1 4-hydroxybenzoate synthetase [Legionella birminghamensis]